MSVKLRKKKLSSGKTSLYLDIYHDGQRHYEFLKLYLEKGNSATNKELLKLAESIRAKKQLEIQHTEYGFTASFKKKSNFVEYFESLVHTKASTDKIWNGTLVNLKQFTQGKVSFSEIDEKWAESFRDYLLSRVSPNTAFGYFARIKTALNKAINDRIIQYNPTKSIDPIRKTETKRDFLTLDEIKALAKTPCKHEEIKQAFLFSCFSGLRLSDVRKLKWENIVNDSIDFTQKKTKGVELLPLSQSAKKLLSKRDKQTEYIFSLPTNAYVCKILRIWNQESDIKKHVTFHVSRHTFATLSLTSGIDLYTVSKLLGHREISTTQIYAKIIDEKKKQAVNMLPEIDFEEMD